MSQGTTILIVGLIGIIIVLIFAIAMGVGKAQRPIVVNKSCDAKPPTIRQILESKKAVPTSSQIAPAGVCPPNYTNYTNPAGNTLCCASQNVDMYSHKCPSLGPKGICSMAPGIEDDRMYSADKKYYPLCQRFFGQSPVSLYQHCDRTGWMLQLPGAGDYTVSKGDYPSDVSYIVVPSGVSATIFTGIFNGQSKFIDQNQSFNFCDEGRWANDNIKSIRIAKATGQLPVIINQHCDKAGWTVSLPGVGDYQTAKNDFPADASHITVPAGLSATIYTGIFSGRSKTIQQNQSFNFCTEGSWANDSIRSIRIVTSNALSQAPCISPGNNAYTACIFGSQSCWGQFGSRFYGNVKDPSNQTLWLWATPNAFSGAPTGTWYNFYTNYINTTGGPRNVFVNAGVDNAATIYINDTPIYSQQCKDFCGQVPFVLPNGISNVRVLATNYDHNSPSGFWVIITDASTGEILIRTDTSWTFTVGEKPSQSNCLQQEQSQVNTPSSAITPGGNVYVMGEIGRGSLWDGIRGVGWNGNAPAAMGVMWIWGSPGLGGNVSSQAVRVPYIFYKNYYNLGSTPTIVNVNASADNYGQLMINGSDIYGRIFAGYAGQATYTLPVGWSQIVYTAENGLSGPTGMDPNPAGIWLTITDASSNALLVKSDSTWTCVQGTTHLF